MKQFLWLVLLVGACGSEGNVIARCHDIWIVQQDVKWADFAAAQRLASRTAELMATGDVDGFVASIGNDTPWVVVPPRPSDLEWYAEHCWNGKVRPDSGPGGTVVP